MGAGGEEGEGDEGEIEGKEDGDGKGGWGCFGGEEQSDECEGDEGVVNFLFFFGGIEQKGDLGIFL